ncbi:hypothetical protein NWP96_04800 [Mycoplasmopsis cynos]|nr:hypothetical protein [Mycoplasmopsis cynos]
MKKNYGIIPNSSIPTITSTSLKVRWYFSNKLRWTKSNRYIICFYKLPHRPSSAWVKNSQKLQKITFPEYDCWQKFDNFINYINKNDKRLRTGKVGEFRDSRSGVSLEDHINNQSKYKFISIGSFGENNEYFDQGLRIVLNERTRKYLLNKNDLVMILNDKTQTFNILGRVLKIDKDDEYIHNQRTQRITLDNKLFLSGYFYFYINSNKFRNKIKQISQGNTQVYINWSIANKCVLKYPSLLDEQNKIAVIFNNINSLITLHQRELKILKIFKKSLFVKMIVGKNLTILSATLTKITNVWEQERLGEIVDYFNGSSNEKEQTNEGKFEIVNLNSISISGELKPSGKFLHNAFETLKKGDIVMILSDIALGNLLGKSAVIIDMF